MYKGNDKKSKEKAKIVSLGSGDFLSADKTAKREEEGQEGE